MSSAWLTSLKRSVNCKPKLPDVKEPAANDSTEKNSPCLCGSGCSRSLSNLRDVIHGSKKQADKAPRIGSPTSIASSEIINQITDQAVLTDSKCVLEIKTQCSGKDDGNGGSTSVGTLRPGTPGPGDCFIEPAYNRRRSMKILAGPSLMRSSCGISSSKPRRSLDFESQRYVCQKCGENFNKLEAIESHHLSTHAVTTLSEGDSSKKVVELICQTSFSEPENKLGEIERVLKIHNMQRTLVQFEDYREMVKLKANKLPKKHPRCLADGNELLRFYGSTVACSLGMENTSSLCTLEQCEVCQILRQGFFSKKEAKGCWGVLTSSTSKRAMESVELDKENRSLRKALVVCRVIAGRVVKGLEKMRDTEGQSSFDSVAGNADCHSNIEELYSLSPRALLPCFILVICNN